MPTRTAVRAQDGKAGAGRTGGGRVSHPGRDRARMTVIDEANIVCSTLSFAGSAAFARLTRK